MSDLLEMREEVASLVISAMKQGEEYEDSFEKYSYLWMDNPRDFMQQFLTFGRGLTLEELESHAEEYLPHAPPPLQQFQLQVRPLQPLALGLSIFLQGVQVPRGPPHPSGQSWDSCPCAASYGAGNSHQTCCSEGHLGQVLAALHGCPPAPGWVAASIRRSLLHPCCSGGSRAGSSSPQEHTLPVSERTLGWGWGCCAWRWERSLRRLCYRDLPQ